MCACGCRHRSPVSPPRVSACAWRGGGACPWHVVASRVSLRLSVHPVVCHSVPARTGAVAGGGSIPGCLSPPPRACVPLSPCLVAAWPRRIPARLHRCSVRLPPAAPGCPPCPALCPGATMCGDNQDSDPRGVSATGQWGSGAPVGARRPPGRRGVPCVRSSQSCGRCGDRAVPATAVGRGQGDLLPPCPKGARSPAGSGSRARMLVGCSHCVSRQRPSGAGTA